jgi:penicillin-binding protein 1C
MLKKTPRPDNTDSILKNQVSWKTGTSSGFRDAWSVGAIGPYVLVVWIGNFDNSSNHAFVGKNVAAPLFFELISGMENEMGHIPIQFKPPGQLHLTQVPVCKASGMLPTRYCKDTELTWFIPGKSPIKTDTIFREVAIDKKTGLRTCHFNQNTDFKIYEFWSSDLLKIFREAGIQRRVPPPYNSDCSLSGDNGLAPQITSPKLEASYIVRANFPTQTRSCLKNSDFELRQGAGCSSSGVYAPVNEQRRTDRNAVLTQNNIFETASIVPLTAVTDADVNTLYWFMNEVYLGESHRDQPFLWQAKAGKYVARVVDDHGRSDARDINVRVEG